MEHSSAHARIFLIWNLESITFLIKSILGCRKQEKQRKMSWILFARENDSRGTRKAYGCVLLGNDNELAK